MNTRIALTALLLVATSTGAAPPERCSDVRVLGARDSDTRFSARNETDLTIEVAFDRTFTGDHLVELVFTTPNGHLYARRTIPITDDPRAPATRTVRGYPRPVTVERLQPGKDGVAILRVAFPFSGTTITKNTLYGEWSLDVTVDGERAPCAAVVFALSP